MFKPKAPKPGSRIGQSVTPPSEPGKMGKVNEMPGRPKKAAAKNVEELRSLYTKKFGSKKPF